MQGMFQLQLNRLHILVGLLCERIALGTQDLALSVISKYYFSWMINPEKAYASQSWNGTL
jgi:hypothetical protein